ncbi:MAG: hypothetical protein IRZ11_03640 [Clostridia bacterium]|nr:hypothetical protein [Clostridia bacterium]
MSPPFARTSAFVFEGGPTGGPLGRAVARVRERLALDRVLALRQAGAGEVAVVSDRPELLAAAGRLGAHAYPAPPPFDWGATLRRIALDLARRDPEAWLLYVGGGAGGLLGPAGWSRLLAFLGDPKAVWQNNAQSPDIVAFCPAALPPEAFAPEVPWPASDNALGYFLSGFGLSRALWPNEPALNFDVDTPAEVGLLAWLAAHAGEGLAGVLTPAVRRELARAPWAAELARRFERVADAIARGGELLLAGRVSPTAVVRLNERWPCRVRVVSEERGMKALGRVERGLVRSLLGAVADRLGPRELASLLASLADAALVDTRVILAHWRVREPEEARFSADLGRTEGVRDPRLGELAAALWSQPALVMGGHTLVYGGVWTLSEALYAARGPVERATGRIRRSVNECQPGNG